MNTHDEGPEDTIRDVQGRRFFHPKTGRVYEVKGYVWDSERDRWLIRYTAYNIYGGSEATGRPTGYVHLPEDFFRAGRFIEVKS